MTEKVRYFYLHDDKNKRHATIARKINFEKGIIEFAYAISAPEDSFSKELGRRKSSGRLKSDSERFEVLLLSNEVPVQTILKHLRMHSHIPNCLRKMAQKDPRYKENCCQQN